MGSGARYGRKAEADISFRAIADHARTMSFLIAEGVAPGNTEREYVLRRIIRRAVYHGRTLGIHRPFLAIVHRGVVEAMGGAYPELKTEAHRTAEVITQEEQRFGETIDRGLELLSPEIKRLQSCGESILSGEFAFKLHDTYGFPLDLTQWVLRDHGIEVDVAGFNLLMEQQRERGRAARVVSGVGSAAGAAIVSGLGEAGVSSRFIGYDHDKAESEILKSPSAFGERLHLIVKETPFYPEGGGQVGDRGVIETSTGALSGSDSIHKSSAAGLSISARYCAARLASSNSARASRSKSIGRGGTRRC